MYYKQSTGAVIVRKSIDNANWVKWVHHSQGPNCCQECLKLDGCLFLESKAPIWPHHPNCHCTLDPVDHSTVLLVAIAQSDYGKFDPYLFNTQGRHPHGKEKLFHEWGYSVADARWLQAEMERQAREKYVAGDYTLGRLNKEGQRISILIEIPRRNGDGTVSFISGWMVRPDGMLRLITPYGGK